MLRGVEMPNASNVLLPGGPLLIGSWLVDPALDRISQDDTVVKLEPRTMRLLLALAQRPGELVTTDELFDIVWKDTIVTSSSVYETVAQLRKALGDPSDEPHYIATVPRKGYRLLARVSAVPARRVASVRPPEPGDGRQPALAHADLELAGAAGYRRLESVPARASAALGLLIVLGILGFTLMPAYEVESVSPVSSVPTTSSASTSIRGATDTGRPPRVLWVDDKPQNNLREREAMTSFGVRFELAQSTEEALQRLHSSGYDLIISDMGRPGDARAGYTLLKVLRDRGDTTRYILFTSSCSGEQKHEANSLGALSCTSEISQLMQAALSVLEARR